MKYRLRPTDIHNAFIIHQSSSFNAAGATREELAKAIEHSLETLAEHAPGISSGKKLTGWTYNDGDKGDETQDIATIETLRQWAGDSAEKPPSLFPYKIDEAALDVDLPKGSVDKIKSIRQHFTFLASSEAAIGVALTCQREIKKSRMSEFYLT